jgi:hypothetical protein
MKWAAGLGVVVSVFMASAARADIRVEPPPREPVRISSKVTIKHGAIKGVDRSVVAKLIVPASLVHPAEPVPPPRPGAAPTRNAPNAPAREGQGAAPVNYRTWIAGIALSLAAVSLVFVLRGRSTTRTVAATVMGGAVLLGAYSAVQANAPAPPIRPEKPAAVRPATAPQIVIELVDEGDSVTLLLAE